MRIASSFHDLAKFRDETRAASSFSLERVALSDQDDWAIRDGVLSHRSRGFFHVAAAVNESLGLERLVLHQPQAAITCLAVHVAGDRPHVLLQARPEPGNVEQVQYGPTIQSTPANFLGLHGGRGVPHLACFTDCVPHEAWPLAQSSQLDLGNRYFQKIKTLMYSQARDWLDTGHDLVWAPLDAIAEALTRDQFLNIDLRAMIACFDWDAWRAGEAAGHGAPPAARPGSVALPSLTASSGAAGFRLAGLDALRGWRVTDGGIEPREPGQPGVGMYHTVCEGRETARWFQPLYEAPGVGQVTLYLRRGDDGGWQVLLDRVGDSGIAGGSAWTASVDRAPEDAAGEAVGPTGDGRLYRSMQLSEEGGRFLWNTNRYEAVEVDADFEAGPSRCWMDMAGLRAILLGSNEATIHLRCAASLVLDLLQPGTFARVGGGGTRG